MGADNVTWLHGPPEDDGPRDECAGEPEVESTSPPQHEPANLPAVVDAHDDAIVPYTYRDDDDVLDGDAYDYEDDYYEERPPLRRVLPEWATSPRAVWTEVTWKLREGNRWFWHHLIRLPLYVAKWCWYMLVGFRVVLPAVWAWVVDRDGYESAIRRLREGRSTSKISDEIKNHRRMRFIRFVFAFVVVPIGPIVAGWVWLAGSVSGRQFHDALGFGHPAGLVALCELVVGMLVLAPLGWWHLGKPKVTAQLPREPSSLVQERMEEVLWALKLLPPPKFDQENPISYIRVIGMPHRTPPPALGTEMRWQFPINSGKIAADIIALDERVAAEFGVKTVQVVIEQGNTPNEVVTWIADHDPFDGPSTPGPYAQLPRTDVWQPIRLGIDPRHTPFFVDLMWNAFLVGGAPGYGKTTVGRIIAMAAARDPFCDIHVMNFKGGSDWMHLKPIARTYVNGVEDDDVEDAFDAMRALVAELDRRFDMFENELSEVDAPDAKITPELARQRGLRPMLLLIDELQEAFDAMEREERDQFVRLLGRFERRGRAAGGITVLMTQRPSSSDKTGAIPAQLKSQLHTRVAVFCADQDTSIAILGKGSVGQGADASKLPDRPGIGIVMRSSKNTMVKFDEPKVGDLRAAAEAGLELRRRFGTLHSSTLQPRVRPMMEPGIDPPSRDTHIAEAEESQVDNNRLLTVANMRPLLPHPYSEMHPTKLGKLLVSRGLSPRRTTQGAAYPVGDVLSALSSITSQPRAEETSKSVYVANVVEETAEEYDDLENDDYED